MVYLFILTVMLFAIIVMTYFFYAILTLVQIVLRSKWGLLLILIVGLYLLFKPH